MHRFLLAAWLILTLTYFSYGQQQKIDSLMDLIKKDPDAEALQDLGSIYLRAGKIEDAQALFGMCIARAIGNDAKLARIYNSIGASYYANDRMFEAEDFAIKSLEKAYSSSDTAMIFLQSSSLAFYYAARSQYEKSNELYEKAIPLTKSLEYLERIHMNLSHNYIKQGKYYDAIVILNKAVKYFNQDLKNVDFTYSYLHIFFAKAFVGLHQVDSALNHIRKAQVDTEKQSLVREEYFELLGHYNRLVLKKKEAIKAYNQALKIRRLSVSGSRDMDYLAYVDSLAKTYQELGLADSAIYFLNFSKARLSENRDVENRKRTEQNYASLEEKILKEIQLKKTLRKNEIQYYIIAIALVLVSFIYLAFSRFDTQRKFSKYISILILLLIFEFVLVWLDPYISKLSGDTPLYNFLINISLAILIIPIHQAGEKLFNKFVLDIKFRKVE